MAKKKAAAKKAIKRGKDGRRINPNAKQKQQQPSKKITTAEIEAALVRHYGNLTATARDLGLASVFRLRERILASEQLTQAMKEGRYRMVGIAEDNYMRMLKAGHEGTTNKTLANFGRDLGWMPDIQRIEHVEENSVEVIEDFGDGTAPGNGEADDGEADD